MISYIHTKHAGLYSHEGRARVKAKLWAPAVTIIARKSQIGQQSIRDWTQIEVGASGAAPVSEAFLVAGGVTQIASDSAELATLAIWGGNDASNRRRLSCAITPRARKECQTTTATSAGDDGHRGVPAPIETVHRHLANAGLLSMHAWSRHPLRSVGRLIPLRFKEKVNRICGRRMFDLHFYLQFQPSVVESDLVLEEPLVYMPEARSSRRRIAFITPHLGLGGAERVFLEIASAIDASKYELFVLATQSTDSSWLEQWRQHAAHVYDLESSCRIHRNLQPAYIQSALTGR